MPNKNMHDIVENLRIVMLIVGCKKMEQTFKEIINGLFLFPFLPMMAIFFAEITVGLIFLKKLRRHALWLLSVALLRLVSATGMLLLEFSSPANPIHSEDTGGSGNKLRDCPR